MSFKKSSILNFFQPTPAKKQKQCDNLNTVEAVNESDVLEEGLSLNLNDDMTDVSDKTGNSSAEIPGTSNNLRYDLLKNPWKPDENYKFSYVLEGKRKRFFKFHWFHIFSWLSYSDLKKEHTISEKSDTEKVTLCEALMIYQYPVKVKKRSITLFQCSKDSTKCTHIVYEYVLNDASHTKHVIGGDLFVIFEPGY
ncbi:hypothetical protein HELRODRAFT_181189 [Helobdella robusta]|uniref:Uncharacterized protein n=1 Tax=Helobdella robusta TaxID=6412 RepID=T1FGQ4_HELRO|nr:hypothetical protein HELRODRAFT_181189 [Helobdella robusta]ESN93249.1 hypothetical protein HELRODRAFT_181189 [Helobdella robusta]